MLLIFGGLPGTGKSSIARAAAEKLGAVYLRMDSLEQALVDSGLVKEQWDLGPAGYYSGYALAGDNLRLGSTVIADSVNPLQITRDAWRQTALDAGRPYLEIEVICSDKQEHHRRVAGRKSDIPGLKLPTWDEVEAREYHAWDRDRLILDTARISVERAVEAVLYAMNIVVNN